MPLTRAQRLSKRRLEVSKQEPPDGLTIYDPHTGEYFFLSWQEVEACARSTMSTPEYFAATEYGKMHYSSDPTYDMRKRK